MMKHPYILLFIFIISLIFGCGLSKTKKISQKKVGFSSIFITFDSIHQKLEEKEWKVYSSPNGSFILTGSERFSNVNFRNKKGKIIWSRELDDSLELESAAISKNGKFISIGAQRGLVYLFNKSGKELWRKKVKGEVQVAITDKGDRIFAMGSSGHILYCYNRKGKLLFSRQINNRNWGTWSLSITPDADRILIGTNSDVILLNGNGQVLKHYDIVLGNRLARATISPNGKYFAHHLFIEKNKHQVVCSDINNNVLWKKNIGYAWFRFDNQNNLYVSSRHGNTRIYNIKGNLIGSLKSPETFCVDVSQSGDILYSITRGNLNIYNRN